MDHELGKQLNEAGFPLGARAYAPDVGSEIVIANLEELIEACGLIARDGENRYEFALFYSMDKCFAGFFDKNFIPHPEINNGEGSTPTEAVTRLWLALNAKGV